MPDFWAKVDKTDGCWLWTGPVDRNGYGVFSYAPSRSMVPHRWAYIELVGPIPEGLELDHLCKVRNCVRPDHLEPVTRAENMHRSDVWETNRSKTHCPQGHPYDEENTCHSRGRRYCRACSRLATRRRRAAKRALSHDLDTENQTNN